MSYFARMNPAVYTEPHGSVKYPIFTAENAPVSGVSASAADYLKDEYPVPGVHEDKEGFYVYDGKGMAMVGDEESAISEVCCFYAPAGVKHQIKKDKDCGELKIFLFHF